MSQTDEEIYMSETDEEAGDSALKLVPVSESIRYRKRAQSAEKKSELLTDELADAKAEVTKLNEQLSQVHVERELTRKLALAGAVDLEVAMLVAKSKMSGQSEADSDSVIEQLKNEKQYLFVSSNESVVSQKTAGVKDRVAHPQAALERAARRAAKTGSRVDLQEYLKRRRNLI
jgi:hypothetical protein